MASTFTPNIRLEKPANGDDINTWDVPVNADWDALDLFAGGNVTLNAVGASGTVVLSIAQYRPRIIIVSGLLTASVNYQFPAGVGGQWTVFNSTSGAFTVTFSSAGAGASVALMQGFRTAILCDTTNVALAFTAPVNAGGSNGQVQFNAAGILTGSANLTFDGTTLSALNGAIGGTLGVTGLTTLSGGFTTPLGTGSNTNGMYTVNFIQNNAVSFLDPAACLLTFENATGGAGQFCYSGSTASVTALSTRVQSTTPIPFAIFYRTGNVGGITTNGSTISLYGTSDGREKELLGVYDPGDLFDKITIYDYRWKTGTQDRGIGPVAQEMYAIAPRLVTQGDDDLGLQYGDEGYLAWRSQLNEPESMIIAELKSVRRRLALLEETPLQSAG